MVLLASIVAEGSPRLSRDGKPLSGEPVAAGPGAGYQQTALGTHINSWKICHFSHFMHHSRLGSFSFNLHLAKKAYTANNISHISD
jgi:hypothetical protein